MSKKCLVTIVGAVCVAVVAVVVVPMAYGGSCSSGGEKKCGTDVKNICKVKTLSLEKIYSGCLPMVSLSVDKAIEAVESGDKETALAELGKAQKMLAAIDKGMGKLVKPGFANVSCPIMGSPIDADKVGENLVRDYKGEKIAFCCGGCPAAWDKLGDAEKDAKLAKVRAETSGHKD